MVPKLQSIYWPISRYCSVHIYMYTYFHAYGWLLCLNVFYPTLHNSHPDQVTFVSMVELLQQSTQPITLYKVKAHINIDGNEEGDKLAKQGLLQAHRKAEHSHKHAYATTYYFQKDDWPSMMALLDKGPVRILEKQIKKYNKENNLEIMAIQILNICKCTENVDIDNKLSNEFWNNQTITYKQKSCINEFQRELTWAKLEKQFFLEETDSCLSHAPFVTSASRIHDYMYYSHANNNTYIHSESKATKKQFGKLENY